MIRSEQEEDQSLAKVLILLRVEKQKEEIWKNQQYRCMHDYLLIFFLFFFYISSYIM